MDPINIVAGVLVAIIAAIGGYAAQRAAARAQKYNADASVSAAKATAELEAYHRARSMDRETIKWQDQEILDLRAENSIIRARLREVETDNEELRKDNVALRRRVTALEEQTGGTNDR